MGALGTEIQGVFFIVFFIIFFKKSFKQVLPDALRELASEVFNLVQWAKILEQVMAVSQKVEADISVKLGKGNISN